MGEIKVAEPVKLIVGMITSETNLFAEAEEKLSRRFGPIDFESNTMPFSHTDYYETEMGKDLKRKFISFQTLVRPEAMADIKIFTNSVEKEFLHRSSNRRRINLDPGYLESSKLVLLSTKNHQHRIYLGKGIYAEVTLRYVKGSFQPWEWTYPDYRTTDYIEIFNRIRNLYLERRTKL